MSVNVTGESELHGQSPSEPASADLVLEDVSVRYVGRREPALSDLDLTISPGERVGVAGRTGAGKSTLALVAAGFIPRVVRAKLSGRATVGDIALGAADGGALLGRVGIIFSTPANQLSASKLTVREELAFGLENLGLPRGEMDVRIDRVLARLGIAHLAEREPFALSGGEQQRVAIASVVTMGTRFLVLDEPTAQLDPSGTASVGLLLDELARDGTTILCAEHDPTILGSLDRCLVLDAGRALVDDVPGRALGSPHLEPIGLIPPTLVRLAEAAGLDAPRAFDPSAVAGALAEADAALLSGMAHAAVHETPEWTPSGESRRVRLAIEELAHRYPMGVEAVRGVSLAFEPGETVAIVGQNGSGKTTLVKHLNGLLRPSAGRVSLDGADISGTPVHELAATVGFVFQNPDDQLFDRSVEREVAFGPRNLGHPQVAIERSVTEALAAVGLEASRQVNPYDLGLSLRKLVALASVLAMDPAVLVLDEPTTGQDDPGVRRVGRIVDTAARSGRTVIAITHDMEFAADHFGRVVVMREGLVVSDGSPTEVFAPGRAGLLASAGLEPPPAAAIGAA
ncbi:MAG: energy-coupling factor ABC transporter ATP-binding protein, partial [Chloroflexota bacterium]|nr:energy-coupling factor ABC transporter ATP-binding protein [Chloroflexota bacterium]